MIRLKTSETPGYSLMGRLSPGPSPPGDKSGLPRLVMGVSEMPRPGVDPAPGVEPAAEPPEWMTAPVTGSVNIGAL